MSSAGALWLNPAAIRFKIAPVHDLSGDWDLDRRHEFKDTAKFRSMAQRYRDGARWIDTELFADIYRRRLAKDGHIGGFRSLADLSDHYHRRWDTIAEDMRRNGFQLARNGKPHPLPSLLIGRDGEVMIGNQGNHRLALAQVLGLDQFAGKVTCRHPLA